MHAKLFLDRVGLKLEALTLGFNKLISLLSVAILMISNFISPNLNYPSHYDIVLNNTKKY